MFLGIEIGGTKLQLGLGVGDGAIVAVQRAHVEPAAGAAGIRQEIVRVIPALLTQAGLRRQDIRAVGIGFGGPVRPESGTVVKSHQISGWDKFPLADWCRNELGRPTVVQNDADTAGLAEACFGAGRGFSPVFYVTIGSGIGGGLIIDEKIYRGAGAGAGEIGHLFLPMWDSLWAKDEEESFPEERYPMVVEDQCSGWGMSRQMRKHLVWLLPDEIPDEGIPEKEDRMLAQGYRQLWPGRQRKETEERSTARQLLSLANCDLNQVTAELIALAAKNGNRLAQRHLKKVCRLLGWAIAQVITLLCPRRIVIGGGVSLIGEELLFAPLRNAAARYTFGPFADCYEIVPAALGESVVVHGALRLAKEAMSTRSD